MSLRLQYYAQTSVPVEIEGFVPDVLRDKPLAEIERFQIFHGNEKLPLAEFFRVSGDASDGRLEFEGNLAGVHWIGAGMSAGSIHVAGDAGRHLGSEMNGGEIHVDGNAGDWVGGEMHGGLIHVRGNAGHLIGAAYRGSHRGMTGGTILIGGNVGNEIGHTLRRGLVAVAGGCGDFAGISMIAGTVLVFGPCGIRPAAGMRRGTLGLFAAEPPQLLPTFRHGCRIQPVFMLLLERHLKSLAFALPEEMFPTAYEIYNGDLVAEGRGEILLRAAGA